MTIKAFKELNSHFYYLGFMFDIADRFRDSTEWVYTTPGYIDMVFKSKSTLPKNDTLLNKAWSIIQS